MERTARFSLSLVLAVILGYIGCFLSGTLSMVSLAVTSALYVPFVYLMLLVAESMKRRFAEVRYG